MTAPGRRWAHAPITHARANARTTGATRRGVIGLTLPLDDRDLQCDLSAVTVDYDGGAAADRRVGNQLRQLRCVADRLPVEAGDDVARFEPSLVGRRAPVELIDESPGGL